MLRNGVLLQVQPARCTEVLQSTACADVLHCSGPEPEHTLQVKSGTQYTLTFWARSTAPEQTIRTEFLTYPRFDRECSSSGQVATKKSPAGLPQRSHVQTHRTDAADTWQRFTHTFTAAQSSPNVRLNIGPNGVADKHVLYIDDIVFQEAERM